MCPVLLLGQSSSENASIGQVLSSVEIDAALAASHVTSLQSWLYVGVMGYAAGENPLSYPELKYEMALELIRVMETIVDYVILDCSAQITNVFTPAAIESGDLILRILTPDLKGIHYLKAGRPLLMDSRFRFGEHLTFACLARPFHALEEMGHLIGKWAGLLPDSKEITRCAEEGSMFGAVKYCNPRYLASLNRILEELEKLEEAEEEQEEDGEPEEEEDE